jgi:hypothetical protein
VTSKPRAAGEPAAEPDTPPWDARILALIDPGIDGSLIEENLRRTPAERLARMQQMLAFLEQAKRDRRPETA